MFNVDRFLQIQRTGVQAVLHSYQVNANVSLTKQNFIFLEHQAVMYGRLDLYWALGLLACAVALAVAFIVLLRTSAGNDLALARLNGGWRWIIGMTIVPVLFISGLLANNGFSYIKYPAVFATNAICQQVSQDANVVCNAGG